MAAFASIEDLQACKDDLEKLKEKHPKEYEEFQLFFTNHKMIGYKNIMKMMLYDKTPEDLKI